MFWICETCRHIAIGGKSPDNCPVCGVPREQFISLDGQAEDVAETGTAANLREALAGESQANIKYLAWAMIAELEGEIEAATLFRQRAEEEVVHAIAHLARLGMIKSTAENLAAAVEGESYERDTMYPDFSGQAASDGFAHTSRYLGTLAHREGVHAEAYAELLGRVLGS